MTAQASKEHQWLMRLVGEWDVESPSPGPGSEAVLKGVEIVRPLGDLWVMGEGSTEMPGGEMARSVITLGYDPALGRVCGTWIGSMMTHLWVYDGAIDADTVVLETSGPRFDGEGGIARYRDIISFAGDDARTLLSRVEDGDGWRNLFTVRYRRTR